MRGLPAVAALLWIAQPVLAQPRSPDSLPRVRVPAKPVIRVWEAGALVGLTAGSLAIDQSVRHWLVRDTARLPSALVKAGNGLGNPRYVYPALLLGTLSGKALGYGGLERVSWRALQSTVLAGAATLVLKSAIGRQRPDVAPHTAFTFQPFTFHGNSFPSGHTTVAFALAASLASETKDAWSDILFYGAATLTAYARINSDKHWLSDTVFGAAIGIVSARLVLRRHRGFVVAPGVVAVELRF